jgi:hypothetical protein
MEVSVDGLGTPGEARDLVGPSDLLTGFLFAPNRLSGLGKKQKRQAAACEFLCKSGERFPGRSGCFHS